MAALKTNTGGYGIRTHGHQSRGHHDSRVYPYSTRWMVATPLVPIGIRFILSRKPPAIFILALLLSSLAFGQQTTTRLDIVYASATAGKIRGYEQGVPKGNYIDLIWPSSMAANYTLTLPKETATILATENHQYSASAPFTWATYRARGTEASPTDISSGDSLGHWTGYGRTSSAYSQMAGIHLTAATTTTGSIDLWTRNGSGYNPRLNISEDGHIYPYGVGTQDVGASSVRFRQGWFVNLDISGTCTGCGGSPPITWTLEADDDILTMQHHLSSGTVARNILTQYSRGTNASPSAAVAADSVFTAKWQYYAGGAYRDAGAIFVNVPSGATVSGTSSPGHLSIFATKHAETAGTEVVRMGAQTASETPAFGAKWFAGLFPSANLTLDLGAFGVEWLTVWTSRIRTSGSTNIDFFPGNAQRWSLTATDGSWLPTIDTGPKIGGITTRVHSIWAMAYNSYTHNSWGAQTNDFSAENSLTHRLTSFGAGYYPAIEFRKARGTYSSPSALSSSDTIAYHLYEGYTPSGSYVFSAAEEAYVDGTPSGSVTPGAWRVYTLNSSGTLAPRLTVRANGNVEIAHDLTITGTCTGCGSSSPPIDWYLNSGSTVLTLGNHGTVSGNQLYTHFSRGTQASPTDAATGDRIMGQVYQYYAGGAYRDTAAILVNIPTVSASVSGSSSPSSLSILATDRSSTSNSTMMEFGAHAAGFGVMSHRTFIPSGNNTIDIGASGYEWYQMWVTRWKATSTMEIHVGGSHRWNIASGSGTLSPQTDGGPNIGSASAKPGDIWARQFKTYTASGFGTQSNDLVADANLNFYLSAFSSGAASDRASLQMHRYRGSQASPSAVLDNDLLGTLAWQGYTSGGLGVGAVIRAYVEGTPGSGWVPTEILFQNVDGFGTLNTNLTIAASGDVTIRTWANSPTFNATTAFYHNGTLGLSQTISVRKGDDSGSCNIVVSGGIVTSTTC